MVQTRSATKKEQALAAVPKPLVREETIIEITTSATGLGTHIRWVRQPQHPNEIPEILSHDLTLDPRFVTPTPEIPTHLTTPPKLTPRRRIGNPGIFNSGFTTRFKLSQDEVEHIVRSARIYGRDLSTGFEVYCTKEGTSPEPTDTFENVLQRRTVALHSPFPGANVEATTPLSLDPHGTHPDISLSPTHNQGIDTGYTHETHLDISQDDSAPSYNQISPSLTQGALLTGGVRGLGPSGTVLIGPDGRAIVPGIVPGYY
ncbi:hypothetical protein BYT27DRAFT_7245970 [Phlegmacium glaucopus]|nr:hypothetical protein BYT27DRAFT_7245970 [Phlegmacium glaucopus]